MFFMEVQGEEGEGERREGKEKRTRDEKSGKSLTQKKARNNNK